MRGLRRLAWRLLEPGAKATGPVGRGRHHYGAATPEEIDLEAVRPFELARGRARIPGRKAEPVMAAGVRTVEVLPGIEGAASGQLLEELGAAVAGVGVYHQPAGGYLGAEVPRLGVPPLGDLVGVGGRAVGVRLPVVYRMLASARAIGGMAAGTAASLDAVQRHHAHPAARKVEGRLQERAPGRWSSYRGGGHSSTVHTPRRTPSRKSRRSVWSRRIQRHTLRHRPWVAHPAPHQGGGAVRSRRAATASGRVSTRRVAAVAGGAVDWDIGSNTPRTVTQACLKLG